MLRFGFMRVAVVGAGLVLGLGAANPAPGAHEQLLRRLISDTAHGAIRYETLTPDLATAVRPMAGQSRSELIALGPLKSVTLRQIDKDGFEIYRTVFEKGVLDWAFHVNAAGLIDNAAYRPAKPAPAS